MVRAYVYWNDDYFKMLGVSLGPPNLLCPLPTSFCLVETSQDLTACRLSPALQAIVVFLSSAILISAFHLACLYSPVGKGLPDWCNARAQVGVPPWQSKYLAKTMWTAGGLLHILSNLSFLISKSIFSNCIRVLQSVVLDSAYPYVSCIVN